MERAILARPTEERIASSESLARSAFDAANDASAEIKRCKTQRLWRMTIAPQRPGVGVIVCLAWERDAAGEIGTAFGLDAGDANRLACPLLGGIGAGERLAELVRWTHDDLSQTGRDAVALGQFANRLGQSYEEVNVLLRTVEILTRHADPAQALRGVCDRTAETLGFGWVVAKFTAIPGAAMDSVSEKRLSSGQVPADDLAFEALLHEVLYSFGGHGEPPSVLTPANSSLARLSGGEVIVQPVRRGEGVVGIVAAGGKVDADPDATSGEIRFIEAAARLIGVFLENVARFEEQRVTFIGTMRALSAAIDAKDPYTRGHSERVAHLAGLLAGAIGLDAVTAERFRVAGLLHDVGKIGVPEAVLHKAGRLSDEEFAQIKRHPGIGHGILKDIPGLADVLPGVLHHHEGWCGRGYPHGLAGEAIPLVARVLALADSFDAMSSDRSYRRRLAREQVFSEILRCGGTQFDPELAKQFVRLDFSGFDAMLATAGQAAGDPTTTALPTHAAA